MLSTVRIALLWRWLRYNCIIFLSIYVAGCCLVIVGLISNKGWMNDGWFYFPPVFVSFGRLERLHTFYTCICYFVISYVQCSIVHMLQSSGQEWASLCVLFEVFWDLLRHKYLMIHPTFLQRGLEVKELNTKPGVENFDETRLKKLKY